jgi:hypothetical protein
MFVGCDDGTQDVNVKGIGIKPKQVSSVSVLITNNNNYVIVSWDAVEYGDAYNILTQQENKKTVNYIGMGQNRYAYATADGVQIANNDIDKWSARISTSDLFGTAKYRFGVATYDVRNNNSNTISDITWSEYIQYTKQ